MTKAIIRCTITVAATYNGFPDKQERDAIKAHKAEFKNGQWVRSITFNTPELIDGDQIPAHFRTVGHFAEELEKHFAA